MLQFEVLATQVLHEVVLEVLQFEVLHEVLAWRRERVTVAWEVVTRPRLNDDITLPATEIPSAAPISRFGSSSTEPTAVFLRGRQPKRVPHWSLDEAESYPVPKRATLMIQYEEWR